MNTDSTTATPKCEVQSCFCSGELLARYTFKKRRGYRDATPPRFWACGPCRVAGLRGTVVVRVPYEK